MATKSKTRRVRAEEFKSEKLNGIPFLGEVVCWSSKSENVHTQRSVRAALQKVGLSPDSAPDILPKSAFTRACKELEDNRSIKIVSRNPPHTVFQFTAEFLNRREGEWQFKKEGDVVLDEDTGKVSSKIQALADAAQKELDRHTEERTTADITRIVQRYFESQADLIPIREQGGVYIVLKQHTHLIDKMEGFLNELGGRMMRLPIPEGTVSGDKTVQECIKEFALGLIAEHKQNIEGFTVNTRNDTLQREADRIKNSRMKIEGYAALMGSVGDVLLKVVKKADQQLVAKINGIQQEKKEMPEKEKGEKRDMVFSQTVTAAIRWMAGQDWTKEEAVKVLGELGISVAMNTISAQFWRASNWKDKKTGGAPAEFDAKETKELNRLIKKVRSI